MNRCACLQWPGIWD